MRNRSGKTRPQASPLGRSLREKFPAGRRKQRASGPFHPELCCARVITPKALNHLAQGLARERLLGEKTQRRGRTLKEFRFNGQNAHPMRLSGNSTTHTYGNNHEIRIFKNNIHDHEVPTLLSILRARAAFSPPGGPPPLASSHDHFHLGRLGTRVARVVHPEATRLALHILQDFSAAPLAKNGVDHAIAKRGCSVEIHPTSRRTGRTRRVGLSRDPPASI
jgi:hypothetical protein